MEEKRYTLAEVAKNCETDGAWFQLACELRQRVRLAMGRYNLRARDIFGWNFDTYVTDPDFIRIGDNCITFVEQDSDRDTYETDLPYAIADGNMTIDEWVDMALSKEREQFQKREQERQEREAARLAQSASAERDTLRRLARKYPTVLREFVGSDEDDEEEAP